MGALDITIIFPAHTKINFLLSKGLIPSRVTLCEGFRKCPIRVSVMDKKLPRASHRNDPLAVLYCEWILCVEYLFRI